MNMSTAQKCPICGKAEFFLHCSCCGFSESQNFQTYPTLMPLSLPADSLKGRRDKWHATFKKRLRCEKCGGYGFYVSLESPFLTCMDCGTSPADELVRPAPPVVENPYADICAGLYHSLVLNKNGTVLAGGRCDGGQCAVDRWKNIVAIAAGYHHSLSLNRNGKVTAVGDNSNGQCDVSDWTGIKLP